MSQVTSITLADGQNTPVNQVFGAVNPQYGTTPAKWLKADSGPYKGFAELTQLLSHRATSSKLSIKVRVPYLNDDGSQRAQNMFVATAYLDDNCTGAERADMMAFIQGLMSDTSVTNAVVSLEPTF